MLPSMKTLVILALSCATLAAQAQIQFRCENINGSLTVEGTEDSAGRFYSLNITVNDGLVPTSQDRKVLARVVTFTADDFLEKRPANGEYQYNYVATNLQDDTVSVGFSGPIGQVLANIHGVYYQQRVRCTIH